MQLGRRAAFGGCTSAPSSATTQPFGLSASAISSTSVLVAGSFVKGAVFDADHKIAGSDLPVPFIVQFGDSGKLEQTWTDMFNDTDVANVVLTDLHVVSHQGWVVAGYTKSEATGCQDVLLPIAITELDNGLSLTAGVPIVTDSGKLGGVTSVALSPDSSYGRARRAAPRARAQVGSLTVRPRAAARLLCPRQGAGRVECRSRIGNRQLVARARLFGR